MEFEQVKIFITGAAGMLAADLISRLVEKRAQLILTDVSESSRNGLHISALDITSYRELEEALGDTRPAWIVNCAAYTAVDRAENERETAFCVNGHGAGNLARAAESLGIRLLHISTDYVFGGAGADPLRRTPYREDDVPDPCGVYGQSKRLGEEQVVAALAEEALIVRTSWLHGVHGPNFIRTILRLTSEKKEIRVVDDQIGSPTWTGWLSDVMIELMEKDARGVFHASSHGDISWFDFAEEIVRQTQRETTVLRQTTAELNRPAPRPAYSTLDVGKLELMLGRGCPRWQESVMAHLEALGSLGRG